ncbi:metalloregulator ArsR/SmtB family transcription factor [Phenylobacterium sp.]|jgi:DNA-binding transcriptional ArsR family regulator|uniref:ArsR/SmtB family transcription factor n=1 Tax=Phenylobacterium sp. TaxID=1871053 RepID=UPI002E33900B|nr:metalloregulator ArsR/SmtB family transcription factor [Phenylobacterium sp.]HEX4710610.1 metalloregulator ArsR/SmtB family transcription factor [Phenylobacterium sp.]
MTNLSAPISAKFAALSDPTRCAIVDRLCSGPATVSELGTPLPIAMPTLLQHLRVLEASGIVSSMKLGRVRTCQVEPAALTQVEEWIAQRRAMWSRRLERLEDYLLAASSPESTEPPK